MVKENCHIIGGDAEKQDRKRTRREYVFFFLPAKPIGKTSTSFLRGIFVGRSCAVWAEPNITMTARVERSAVVRRKYRIVTPTSPSVLPLDPLSTEYPIGKGFSSVTEFRSLQTVIPPRMIIEYQNVEAWRHRVACKVVNRGAVGIKM